LCAPLPRAYFLGIPALERATDLVDAQILLTYAFGASSDGGGLLEETELRMWFRVVEQRLAASLSEAARRNWVKEQGIMLECRRQAAFFPGPQVSEDSANQAFVYWHRLVA
jgi:hypothetical protein